MERVHKFIPIQTVETIFFCIVRFDQKHEAKRDNGMFQPTWHCCIFCNPANGKVDGWLAYMVTNPAS